MKLERLFFPMHYLIQKKKKKSKNAESPGENQKKSFPRQHASELGSRPQQRGSKGREAPEGLLGPVLATSPPYVLSQGWDSFLPPKSPLIV